ncbi:bifunctional UDP-N-acetylglucosamine pyrophosphorylase/glucosamine-1-phosphate N-acetyltransferase [Pseudochelatococcus lubricantis]|uniref:Bifunctional protein GlmU n=1 Tax=Pseudochelatococcus lubricantis TaxID=1538102 RepID=A0ABX0UXU4_9HYPH|nr:bifunctional UDP-N-acetylglucosamine diphosphorylase/glucosamine-1-phosphate N-acetyltransferase GlmU [Pseudochelatococcus lubricantis]NIJ56720.1 bifunctional UDP-N-acetylglucosamine pyrophosphorylase/glucosamine-1-phosphate N-acetyltransferase [Pseudochelatococcus lubricantis]
MSADHATFSAASGASFPAQGRRALAVVLAAGEGTRMLSRLPKILHRIANRPIVSHVLDSVRAAGVESVAVVVGPGREDVAAEVRSTAPGATIHIQQERLGTAHAALAARAALEAGADDVIIAFGDTPLVEPQTFDRLRAVLTKGASVVVLGFEAKDPTGYGRLLIEDGELVAIREHRDASEAERAIRLCNGGIMAIAGAHALPLLEKIDNANAKGEYYLTDVVAHARAAGLHAKALVAGEEELLGINDRAQLAAAEAVIQNRLRLAAFRAGVTLVAPETVFFSWDTALGRDVVVEPHVVFGPGVTVEEGAVVHAFSHLAGAVVRSGADVGPFARLRPGADVGTGAHVGNFVEIKNAKLGEGVKAGHLSYLGDAEIGAGTNIGAGTITCNYDGYSKHRTLIGSGAFIGSNSSLVAPVSIGDGAYTGSGSVVTRDVPADALALGRAQQVVKEGWAARLREFRAAVKTGKS